jgi:hypothetical protein
MISQTILVFLEPAKWNELALKTHHHYGNSY